jgi:hypothetical protein
MLALHTAVGAAHCFWRCLFLRIFFFHLMYQAAGQFKKGEDIEDQAQQLLVAGILDLIRNPKSYQQLNELQKQWGFGPAHYANFSASAIAAYSQSSSFGTSMGFGARFVHVLWGLNCFMPSICE